MTESTFQAHLSDAELLAWLDGSRERAEHVAHCQTCRQRAEALRIEAGRWQFLLYRAECPSAQTLAEYAMDLLSDQEKQAVRAHIETCPLCAQELAWQQQFMTETPIGPASRPDAPALRDGVRVIVARWVNRLADGPGASLGMQFALGPMRGGGQRPMLFDAGEVQVTLEFYEDAAHPGRHQLVGLLVGEAIPDSFRVELWRDAQRVAEAQVDDLGNFSIGNLAPARYNLKVIHPRMEIQLNDLEI